MNYLTNLFKTPTATQVATSELAQAQRELLVAQSGYEYAKRIAEFNIDRVRRLTAYLADAK